MFKILHVLDGFGVGGAEKWLLTLTKYATHSYSELAHEFLCTGGEKRVLDDEILKYGGKIHYVKYSSKHLGRFRASVIPILKSEKYNMIWNHSDYISGYQYLAVLDHLPKLRLTYLHNPLIQTRFYRTSFLRNALFHIGKYITYLLSTHTTGTSDEVMNEYGYNHWPFYKKRIPPIHCAFDVSIFTFNPATRKSIRDELKIQDQDVLILFVGRLSLETDNPFPNQKNPQFAFEISKRIASVHKNYKFLFVGDKGHIGLEMENEILALGLQSQIRLLGVMSEVAPYYFASDLMVFPSLYEGLGMVAVEAQCANLPVLMSTNVPLEACVDTDLVTRLDLDIEKWISAITVFRTKTERTYINTNVNNSDFNIEKCEKKINLFIHEQKN